MATNKNVKPQNPIINRSHPLARGLVGAWAFQDGGGDVLRDVSGHGHNGTLVNSPTRTNEQYGGGLNFNGSNQWVEVPSAPMYVGLNDLTLIWHQSTDDTNAHYMIFDQRNTTGPPYAGFSINWNTTANVFTVEFNGTTRVAASSPSVTGFEQPDWTWWALSCIRTGNATLYRNGQQWATWDISAASGQDVQGTNPFKIAGHHGNSSAWVYDGRMDYMAMWHKALSANEVADLYTDPFELYEPARPIIKYFYAAPSGAPPGAPHSPQSDIILLDDQSAISTTYPLAAEGLIVIEERLFRRQRPVAGDRLVFADPIKVQQGKLVIASDGLSLTENFSLYVGPLHEVREQEGIEISEVGAWGFLTDLSGDRVGLAETFSTALLPPPVVRTGTDGLILSDAAATDLSLSWIGAHDGIKLSDPAPIVTLTFIGGDPTPEDGLILTEQGALQQGYSFDIDTIHLSETIIIALNRAVTDNILLGENIAIGRQVSLQSSDVVEFSEAGLLIEELHFDLDGVTLTEIVTLKLEYYLYPAETILLNDQTTVRVNYGVPVQDGIKLAEAIVDPRVYFVEEPLDAILLTDEIKVRMGYGIPLTDAVRLADVEATGVQHGRRAYEGISFGDSSQTLKTQHRNIGDGVKIGEKILKNQLAIGSTVRLQGTIEDLLILTATIR